MTALGKSLFVGLGLLFCLSLPGCGSDAGESELSVASVENPKRTAWGDPSIGLPPPKAAGSELGQCRSQSVGGDLFGENSASLVVDCVSGSLRPQGLSIGAYAINGEGIVTGAAPITRASVVSTSNGIGSPLPCRTTQGAVDCGPRTEDMRSTVFPFSFRLWLTIETREQICDTSPALIVYVPGVRASLAGFSSPLPLPPRCSGS